MKRCCYACDWSLPLYHYALPIGHLTAHLTMGAQQNINISTQSGLVSTDGDWGQGGNGDGGSQDIIIILGFTDENETCYNHLLFDFILQLTININRWFRRPTMVIVNDGHHGGFFGITEIFCVEHGVQVKGVSLVLDFNHIVTIRSAL